MGINTITNPSNGRVTCTTDLSISLAAIAGISVNDLTLIGSGNIDAYGDAGDNLIVGNSGDNLLGGGGGSDVFDLTSGGRDTINLTLLPDSSSAPSRVIGFSENDVIEVDFSLGFGEQNVLVVDGASYIRFGQAVTVDPVTKATNAHLILDNYTGLIAITDMPAEHDVAAWQSQDQFTAESTILPDDARNLFLLGSANLYGIGNAHQNMMTGNAGNNELDGMGGQDILIGGVGNDLYYYHTGDQIIENANEGNDTLVSWVDAKLPDNVEVLNLQGPDDIAGHGNAQNNRIIGNTGANTLGGGGGTDVLIGEDGDDVYDDVNLTTAIVEAPNGGNDTVFAQGSFILPPNVESLRLMGDGEARLTGNGQNNLIVGNSNGNILVGGGGTDILVGGQGNDLYFPGNLDTLIVEAAGEGRDGVRIDISYTLPDNVETLFLFGSANINGIGNDENNYIEGNSGNNILDGRGGRDTLNGGAGNDTYLIKLGTAIISETPSGSADVFDFSSASQDTGSPFQLLLFGFEAVDRIVVSARQLNTATGAHAIHIVSFDGVSSALFFDDRPVTPGRADVCLIGYADVQHLESLIYG